MIHINEFWLNYFFFESLNFFLYLHVQFSITRIEMEFPIGEYDGTFNADKIFRFISAEELHRSELNGLNLNIEFEYEYL